MLHRGSSASFVRHRNVSPLMRSGGRSARHSPPPSSRTPTSSISFRSRPPPPRGIGYVPSYRPRIASPLHYRSYSRSSSRCRAPGRIFVPVSPPRSSFRAAGGRHCVRASVRVGRAPPPPRIPYHCRTDISPRRTGSRSRSPPMLPRGRGGGIERRAAFRGGGCRPTLDRSKFIGNFGRPINHPPSYEVSPDRTAPPPSTTALAASAAVGIDAVATADDANDGPVVVPSAAAATVAMAPGEELPSNRDELYMKMLEAKKSENLDEYYRLRDALNAFDKRNPHLAYRGSGAVVVRRKRSRSVDKRREEEEEEARGVARKRRRSGDEMSNDDGKRRHNRHQSRHHSYQERNNNNNKNNMATITTTEAAASKTTTTTDELEEVDSVGKQFDDEDEEEVGFDLVENEQLNHEDELHDSDQQNQQQQQQQQAVITPTPSDLWASFSHLGVSEQLRLLRARVVELERLQPENDGVPPQHASNSEVVEEEGI